MVSLGEKNDKLGKWDLEQQLSKCVPCNITPGDVSWKKKESSGLIPLKALTHWKKSSLHPPHIPK